MLDMTRKAIERTKGLSRSRFDEDETLQLALAHLVQVIGEAAGRVSPRFQRQHAEIPWREIIGIRHRIVHDYLSLDLDILWAVATRHLESLAGQLEGILAEGSGV